MACCDVRWGVKIYSKYSIYFEWNFDAIIPCFSALRLWEEWKGLEGRGGLTGQLHKSGV